MGRQGEPLEGPLLFLFSFRFLLLQLICIPSALLSVAEAEAGKGVPERCDLQAQIWADKGRRVVP